MARKPLRFAGMNPADGGWSRTKLFGVSATGSGGYDAVSRDGRRILTVELPPPTNQDKIGARLIQNWVAALAQ